MKEGWEIVKIKDVCNKASSNVAQKSLDHNNGDYPIFGASGFIKNVDFFHFDKPYIGIVKDGSGIGRVNIYPAYSSLLGTLQYILPKDNCNLSFLAYALKSLDLSSHKAGAAIPHIYFRDYGEEEICFPPLTEQERIVSILDKAFEKIDAIKANAEENLANAKALFQANCDTLLTRQSDWITNSLKSICSKIGSGATPRGGKSSYKSTGICLIRSLNVWYGEFKYENLAHIDDAQAEALNNVEICEQDVLFNITGASIARSCVVPNDVLPARVNQHVSILRVQKDTLLPELLCYILISRQYQDRLLKIGEGGATRQAITKKQLEDFYISYPAEIKQQQKLISIINRLSSKCKEIEQNSQAVIAECDALKQAILRKAFNGEL